MEWASHSCAARAGVARRATAHGNIEGDIIVEIIASRHLRMNTSIRPIPITKHTGYMLESLTTLTGFGHSSPFRMCTVLDLYRQVERVVYLRFTKEYGSFNTQLKLVRLCHFNVATANESTLWFPNVNPHKSSKPYTASRF